MQKIKCSVDMCPFHISFNISSVEELKEKGLLDLQYDCTAETLKICSQGCCWYHSEFFRSEELRQAGEAFRKRNEKSNSTQFNPADEHEY